jgi:hypothetical protein
MYAELAICQRLDEHKGDRLPRLQGAPRSHAEGRERKDLQVHLELLDFVDDDLCGKLIGGGEIDSSRKRR